MKNYNNISKQGRDKEQELSNDINTERDDKELDKDADKNKSTRDKKIKTYVVINTDLLRLRENPSSDSEVVTLLERGCKIQDASADDKGVNGWVCVNFGEYQGYVMTLYIKEV